MITDLTINSLSCRNEEQLNVGVARRWLSLFRLLMSIGLVTAAAGVLLGGPRFWNVLLLVSVYLVGLGLAGAALMTFEYLSGAGWSVALRRVPEAMTALLPVGGAGVLLVLVCQRSLYPWTNGEHHFIGFKAIWLNWPFFVARAVAYLAIWIAFARTMVYNSRQQDATGDRSLRERNVAVSAAFVVLFALTVWLASMDWLMTLEPEWFSTIYGVYHFSGIMASGIAAVILFGLWLRRLGPWHNVLREEHLQDLGKLLLTFCTFWAYIWFSQYMLIWYANIPEETGYYVRRMSGAWGSLMIVSLLMNWAIPFFVLLPRGNKRNGRIIGQAAIVVLVGRWLDLYLSIVPANPEATPMPDVWMVGLTLGLLGVTGMLFWRAIRQATVVPVGDPYLSESLHYHR
jgi:hypothetical protein